MRLSRVWWVWAPVLVAAGLLAVGCAAERPRPAVGAGDAPEPVAPAVPCPLPVLKTAAMPAALAVDGDLSEWGAGADKAQLRLAIDDRRVAIAVDRYCDEPITLALAAAAPPYPRIGWVGGPMLPIDIGKETCAREIDYAGDGGTKPGAQHAPEDQRRCLEMLAQAEKKEATLTARFRRDYRLRRDGVFDGGGRRIKGATVAHKPGALEVSLPLRALPRVAEAPWEHVYAAAALGPHAPKLAPVMLRYWEEPKVPVGWTALRWLQPFSPDSYADIRWAGASRPSNGVVRTVASYQPAKPDVFEIVETPHAEPGFLDMTRPVLVIRQEQLLTKVRDYGQVGIGWSHTGSLTTSKAGQVVATHGLPRERVFDLERGDVLHMFGYHGEGYAPGAIPARGYWEVIAITQDGTISELGSDMAIAGWDSVPQPHFDAALGEFGFDGRYNGKPRRVIWKWNATDGRYDAPGYNPFVLP